MRQYNGLAYTVFTAMFLILYYNSLEPHPTKKCIRRVLLCAWWRFINPVFLLHQEWRNKIFKMGLSVRQARFCRTVTLFRMNQDWLQTVYKSNSDLYENTILLRDKQKTGVSYSQLLTVVPTECYQILYVEIFIHTITSHMFWPITWLSSLRYNTKERRINNTLQI
jgi:hypothetical protein